MTAETNPAFDPPAGRRQIPVKTSYTPTHTCSPEVRKRVLSTTPLFADLTEDELAELDQRMMAFHSPADAFIYAQGEAAASVFVLAAGRLKVYRSTEDGHEVVVDLLGSGDAFGHAETLGQIEHTETVQTLTSTCILRLDAVGFRAVLREFPSVGLRVIDELSGRLMQSRSDVTRRSTTSVTQRVAATLLRLGDRFGERDQDGILIQLPLSRADLAGITGSTPESVSRVMSRLRKEGVVESGRRWTRILDPEGLEKLSAVD